MFVIDSPSSHHIISKEDTHIDSAIYSSDETIWRAQFDGIRSILEWDDNQKKLQQGEGISIQSKICPYHDSLEREFDIFYSIFYTRLQAWVVQYRLSYSQKILDNGIIEMIFVLKTH